MLISSCAFGVEMEVPCPLPAPENVILYGCTVATYCHFHYGADTCLAPAIVDSARRSLSIVSLLSCALEESQASPVTMICRFESDGEPFQYLPSPLMPPICCASTTVSADGESVFLL